MQVRMCKLLVRISATTRKHKQRPLLITPLSLLVLHNQSGIVSTRCLETVCKVPISCC